MTLDALVHQAARAARSGHPAAEEMLDQILARDHDNIAAWWWLGKVTGDAKKRHFCRDMARKLAVRSGRGLATLRGLLEETRAPQLSTFQVAVGSRSFGSRCPVCTTDFEAGDIVVYCPESAHAHHAECWESNGYQCGLLACPGVGLIGPEPVAPEAAAREETVSVEERDIPEAVQHETTAEKEERFMGGLLQRAFLAALERESARQRQEAAAGAFLGGLAYVIEEAERRSQAELAAQLARRAFRATLLGLVLGGLAGYYAYHHGLNAVLAAVHIAVVIAVTCGVVGVQMVRPFSRFQRVFYWTIPLDVAVALFANGIDRWGAGLLAVAVSAAGGVVAWRVLSRKAFRDRMGPIAALGLVGAGYAIYALLVILGIVD